MAYDNTIPNAGHALSVDQLHLLANFVAMETALNREHEFSTGGTAADQGHHKRGSARCHFQDDVPTTRVGGEAFNAQDNGSLWFDTNSSPDNQFNVLTDYSGPTWTPISAEIIAVLLAANRIFAGTLKATGDFTVGANKVVVTAANGNTAIAGTLGVAGIATLADGSKNATSAAPEADAEFANKKYADDQDAAITDPTYEGGESHTFIGDLTIKQGAGSIGANEDLTITFATAFSNACVNGFAITASDVSGSSRAQVMNTFALSTTSMHIFSYGGTASKMRWFAMGY